jgi:hypothetical protein
MNIKQKMELYDYLYKRADKLIRKHNPCEMKDGKCLRGSPCCDGCNHLTADGCVIDCLMCKLFLCWRVSQRKPVLVRTFRRMQTKAYRHGLLHIRYSKKEMITFLQKNQQEVSYAGKVRSC